MENCHYPSVIKEKNFDKARALIKKEKQEGKSIIFVSDDDELSRKILEKSPPNILVILQANRKDFQKQRDSGFNQVLAAIAKKANVTIGICLDEIANSEGKQKAEILARARQNIKICSKAKLPMKFCGKAAAEKNIYDLKSLGLTLGMPTWMTSKL